MKWYEKSVFYHIYPLGLCDCPHENEGKTEEKFEIIEKWTKHAWEIGCNAIYIGPLFESGSHGYDTIDYRKVDSRLGTNEDFKNYVKHCHERGQKVIVDGVFNHVGRDFFAFVDVKEHREQSKYCGWFCDLNFGGNNEYNDGFCYANWGGYNLLVKLNQQNPEVRQYLLDSVGMWIDEFDIDGIRLDAADVLDFEFMKALRHFTDSKKEDFWLMGEVIHGDYSRWANGEMLHSVTNYELHKGLYSGHNDHNYFEIAHSMKRLLGICGKTTLYTFVDNHDVERIYSKLNCKDHIRNVFLLLYTVPGVPSIYYGSEYGIEGKKENGSDWGLRPALNEEECEKLPFAEELLSICTVLGKAKAEEEVLSSMDYKELHLTNRQFAFAKILDGKAAVTMLNCDDAPSSFSFPNPVGGNEWKLLSPEVEGAEIKVENGQVQVSLPANQGVVIKIS